MIVIGVTGGVGSGKSEILTALQKKYNCFVIYADQAAHEVEKPGQPCYQQLLSLLSDGILAKDGTIDRKKMAEAIFQNAALLQSVNAIVHPAVKQYICDMIKQEKEKCRYDILFIEAALLIEDGYLSIVDEMWYVYADRQIREKRLMQSRNYSMDKIKSIMDAQLSEEEYRSKCSFIIDNSGSLEESLQIIDRKVREYDSGICIWS